MQTTTTPQHSRRPFTAAVLSTLVTAGVFGVGGVLLLLWLFARDGVRAWEQMAWWGPVVVLTTGLALLAAMGTLVLRGWKPRLPAAVFLALGLLPWLVGALGTRWGVRMCSEAIANVNPMDKATILMAGIQEALVSYLFGGGLSAALLVGLALGLGVAALVLASGRRKERAPDVPAIEVWPAVSAALLCLAAALAVLAYLPSASVHRDFFSAMSNVNPADRVTLLVHTADALGPTRVLKGVLLGAALLLGVGAARWGRRAGAGVGRALAAGLCVAPAFALHALAHQDMKAAALTTVKAPWTSAGDFQPALIPGLFSGSVLPQALVTRTHLLPPHGHPGTPVALEAALAPALRQLLDEDSFERAAWANEERLEEANLWPRLALAVDGRLDGAKLRGVLEAARTAGANSLILVGQSPASPALARMESEPLLAPLLMGQVRSTAPVALVSALPRDYFTHHPEGWDGHLGSASVLALTPRPGAIEEPLTVDLSQVPSEEAPTYGASRLVPVYLTLGADVTAEQLVRASEALSSRSTSRRRLVPVLLMAPLPGPEAPMVDGGPR